MFIITIWQVLKYRYCCLAAKSLEIKKYKSGIAKYLKQGRLTVNSIQKQLEVGRDKTILSFNDITPSEWGYVYEKFVGQILEDEGYKVEYSGLELGFLDSGIDLIATKESETLFIQCKYMKGKISKSAIEWILYKASKKLLKSSYLSNTKNTFMLVVNSKDSAFGKKG